MLAVAWVARQRHRTELTAVAPSDGISFALAQERARTLSVLRYDLTLNIPERKQDPVRGRETIFFQLADPSHPLLIDFAQPADRVLSVSAGITGAAGAQKPAIQSTHGHLVIPPASLQRGENQIAIEFIAGDLPLNRNDDFLYSL